MKLSKYLPRCATCGNSFVPNYNSIELEVSIFPVIVKNYLFCSQNCFDKKVAEVRSKPITDGFLYVGKIERFEKISDFPKKWAMTIQTTEIKPEIFLRR